MKTANIILRGIRYQLERLSEKTFKIHYEDRPYEETTSWNVDFMQKTKMVEDISKWLKDEFEIEGNQYFAEGEES
jgi:hypothetical protein